MGAFDRLWELFGVPGESDEQENENGEVAVQEPVQQEPPRRKSSGNNNLVGLPGGAAAGPMQVVISEPANIKDAKELADQLKARKQVIINLENTPRDISQRIIDFISGTVHAIEGQSQQVGRYIFVFTPRNMAISKDERVESGAASGRRTTTAGNSMFFMPSDQNVEENK